MEQSPTTTSETPAPPAMSLPARLVNVLATPGDVIGQLESKPAAVANWLTPTLLWAIAGVISVFVIFSQPAILQQIREQQSKAIEQRVQAGKMTQDQADKALAMMEQFGSATIVKVSGSVAVVLMGFWHLFWWGFVLWLIGRWLLKVPVGFHKLLEWVGLAMMINLLSAVVGLLLTVVMGHLGASPSLALFISDFDLNRKDHLALAAANPFYFWNAGVMALGLAKLANVPFVKAAGPVFGYFVVQEALLILSGLGQFAM